MSGLVRTVDLRDGIVLDDDDAARELDLQPLSQSSLSRWIVDQSSGLELKTNSGREHR